MKKDCKEKYYEEKKAFNIKERLDVQVYNNKAVEDDQLQHKMWDLGGLRTDGT